MRHAPLAELPESIRQELLHTFPVLAEHTATAEVLWLSVHDFPRVRLEDVAAGHLRVILSPRPWRFCHGNDEQEVQPFEPVLVLRKVPVPVVAAPARQGRMVHVALPLLGAAAIGLGIGLSAPRSWSTLEAAELSRVVWHDEESLIQVLEQGRRDPLRETLLSLAAHHPSARVRAAVERIRKR